jgi:hypothetical protein
MADEGNDTLHQVQNYRKLVLLYEAVQQEINALIHAAGGATEKMSAADRARYRELARRRDELQNDMRYLEQQLLDDQ